jgi:hypothetical protein
MHLVIEFQPVRLSEMEDRKFNYKKNTQQQIESYNI